MVVADALAVVLGSLVLIALGIIGEYIGKIFVEVKHRPRFHVAEETKN